MALSGWASRRASLRTAVAPRPGSRQQAPAHGLHRPGAEPRRGCVLPPAPQPHCPSHEAGAPSVALRSRTHGCQGPHTHRPLQVHTSCPLLTNARPPETHTPAPTPSRVFCAKSRPHAPQSPAGLRGPFRIPCSAHSCSPSPQRAWSDTAQYAARRVNHLNCAVPSASAPRDLGNSSSAQKTQRLSG